ncbi:MAG: hypothetical protein IID46_00525 [Planctomycetes bacterium]|nr:hypothetical protein [Planctomycetota bacterium]
MLTGIIRRIYNRKALFGLCVLTIGLGIALILLATAGEMIHFLSPNQSHETGEEILFRLLGGMVLMVVGFSGLVLGSANFKENVVDWMEGREPGNVSMEICCCACRALNDVQAVCCHDCGADLSPADCRLPRNASGHTDPGIGLRNRSSIPGPHALNVRGRGDKIIKISPKTERAGIKTSR